MEVKMENVLPPMVIWICPFLTPFFFITCSYPGFYKIIYYWIFSPFNHTAFISLLKNVFDKLIEPFKFHILQHFFLFLISIIFSTSFQKYRQYEWR